jgi:hypothetical protein
MDHWWAAQVGKEESRRKRRNFPSQRVNHTKVCSEIICESFVHILECDSENSALCPRIDKDL